MNAYIDPLYRPFGCPPDIVLDLPVPPSVNRTRKVDWRGHSKYVAWRREADKHFLLVKRENKGREITGQFEAIVTISGEHTSIDLDNGVKALLDYARRLELVPDDSPKYLRKLTVEWGKAQEGCRLTLRPIESDTAERAQ